MPRDVVVSGQKPAHLDLTLRRRGEIRALILDPAEDAALEGVTVLLLGADGTPVQEADSGSDGTCRFSDIRAGEHRIRVEPPTGFRARDPERLVHVSPAGTVEVVFDLERSGVVRGRVVDEDTQEPLAGVAVRLYNSTGTLVREAVTVSTGEYEFTNLPEDRYEVEVDP